MTSVKARVHCFEVRIHSFKHQKTILGITSHLSNCLAQVVRFNLCNFPDITSFPDFFLFPNFWTIFNSDNPCFPASAIRDTETVQSTFVSNNHYTHGTAPFPIKTSTVQIQLNFFYRIGRHYHRIGCATNLLMS